MFYQERCLPTLEDIENNVVRDRRRVSFILAQREREEAARAARLAGGESDKESREEDDGNGQSSNQEASRQEETVFSLEEKAPSVAYERSIEEMGADFMEDAIEVALQAARLAASGPPPHIFEQAMRAARIYFHQPSPEPPAVPSLTRQFIPYVGWLRSQHDALYEAYHRGPMEHAQLPDSEWAQFIHALPSSTAEVVLSSPDHLEGISDGDLTVDTFINSMREILDNAMGGAIPELGYAVPDASWMDGYLPELPTLEPWYFADMIRAMVAGETTDEWEQHLESLGLRIDYRASRIKPFGALRLRGLVGRWLEIRREKERNKLVKRMKQLVKRLRILQSANRSDVHGPSTEELPAEIQKLGISKDTTRAAIIRLLKPRGYDPEISGDVRQWCDYGMVPSQQLRLPFPEYNPRVHGTFPQWNSAGRPTALDLRGPFTFGTRYTPSVHGTYQEWILMGRPTARLLQIAARQLIETRGWENTLGEYDPVVHGTIREWYDGFITPNLRWDNRGTNGSRLPVSILAGERSVIMKRARSDDDMPDLREPKRTRHEIVRGLRRW